MLQVELKRLLLAVFSFLQYDTINENYLRVMPVISYTIFAACKMCATYNPNLSPQAAWAECNRQQTRPANDVLTDIYAKF